MYKSEFEKLGKLVDQYNADYLKVCKESRRRHINGLVAGGIVPEEINIIYDEEGRLKFENLCKGYQEEAEKIMDSVIRDLKGQVSYVPTADDVALLTMLNMRSKDNLSAEEIACYLDKYKDTPQMYNAIADIYATKNGKEYAEKHPLLSIIEETEKLKDLILDVLKPEYAGTSMKKNGNEHIVAQANQAAVKYMISELSAK